MKTRIGFGVLGTLLVAAVAAIVLLGVALNNTNVTLAQSEAQVAQLKGAIATPIELGLAPLDVERVWGYSGGRYRLYDPAIKEASDLAELTPGQGYWVKVDRPQTISLGGYTYTLVSGWNLIGWR